MNPLLSGAELPRYDEIQPGHVAEAVEKMIEEVEKGLAPVAQLAAHDPDAVVRRQRRGEERPQPGRVAPQHSRRFEHGMRPTSRRYSRCGASGASAVLTSV